MNRIQLIQKLLTTLHLNVFERKIFDEQALGIEEIINVIEFELKSNKIFPPNATIWKPGQAVYEGSIIEKINNNEFLLHYQRAYPMNPFELAEKSEIKFQDFTSLIHAYIQENYRFNIDGINVVRSRT
jgi:hypothetical protein